MKMKLLLRPSRMDLTRRSRAPILWLGLGLGLDRFKYLSLENVIFEKILGAYPNVE